MTIEVIGNYLVMNCPNCRAEITELMKPSTKENIRKKKFLCPLCGNKIE